MVPSDYNNNVQILQTPDHVVLHTEMIHNARIVPLDGRPHISSSMRQWMGDSRGRWEGDTLVVDTTNYVARTDSGPARFPGFMWRRNVSDKGSDRVHVIERFMRLDKDTLRYEFTVDDPGTFTAPWTARVDMSRTKGPIYEYACHEGNYAMYGMLSSARAVEGAAKEEGGAKTRSR